MAVDTSVLFRERTTFGTLLYKLVFFQTKYIKLNTLIVWRTDAHKYCVVESGTVAKTVGYQGTLQRMGR